MLAPEKEKVQMINTEPVVLVAICSALGAAGGWSMAFQVKKLKVVIAEASSLISHPKK